MAPELTEEWAAVYLHITVILLTFGLGLPSLIIDLMVDEEIRQVIHRRLRVGRWVAMTGAFVVSALFFVWLLHPGDAPASERDAIIGASLVTLLLGATCFSWWFLMSTYRREAMIERLTQRAIRALESNGRPPEDALEDLSYLGRHGRTGHDKRLALEAFEKILTETVVRAPFRGDDLDPLIGGIEAIVVDAARPASAEEMVLVADMLTHSANLIHKKNKIDSPDAGLISRCATRIGVHAAKQNHDRAVFAFVELASDIGRYGGKELASRALFELGAFALKDRSFLPSVAALNALESISGGSLRADSEVTFNLLGLAACFSMAGSAAGSRGREMISRSSFHPSQEACTTATVNYFAGKADFDTAEAMITVWSRLS